MGAPRIPPVIPPSRAPEKPLIAYASILGKPDTLDEAGLSGPEAPPSKGPLEIQATGTPPLRLQRNESVAAVLTVIEIKRHGSIKGYVGLDASDNIVIIKADGTTVLVTIASTGELDALLRVKAPHLEASTDVKTPKVLDGAGTQVVAAQQPAIADAVATSGSTGPGGSTGGTPTDPATLGDVDGAYAYADGAYATAADALGTATAVLTTLNTLLGELAAHGLIAP